MVDSLQYPIYLDSTYEIGRYPIGYTNQEEYPTDRAPAGWGPIAGGGIQFESILILPALSILPYPRSYRREIYTNPTYRFSPEANWRRILLI